MRIPSPAIKPELRRTPFYFLVALSFSLLLALFPINCLTAPPIKTGVIVERGRYIPTANGREGTPRSSATIAKAPPTKTSPQGRSPPSTPSITVFIKVA